MDIEEKNTDALCDYAVLVTWSPMLPVSGEVMGVWTRGHIPIQPALGPARQCA